LLASQVYRPVERSPLALGQASRSATKKQSPIALARRFAARPHIQIRIGEPRGGLGRSDGEHVAKLVPKRLHGDTAARHGSGSQATSNNCSARAMAAAIACR